MMNKKKILVIDDNKNFLTVISRKLEEKKYTVIAFEKGEEAITVLDNDCEIQVLLVDLKMPGFSGKEFFERIKDFERPLKRIVITAEEDLLDEKEAEELKIFSYLIKSPNIKHSLLFAVKSAFNELELEEVRQWRDLALITTDTVHLIGNKISPIRRRIDEISKVLNLLLLDNKIDIATYEKIDRDIQIIKDSAEQTYSIKSDLIDRSIVKKQLNLIDLLNEVVLKFKKENSQILINFVSSLSSYFVSADELFLKRVFNNIIRNAIHAIEDKYILNQEHLEGIISINIECEDNYVVVDFKDNGCGIEDRDINRIFLPFFTTKGADRGNGIGLYFCKRTIEDIGGEILIKENKIGEGAIFSLRFPKVYKNLSCL
jgi:signal transduction histidine kinase